MRAYAAIGVFVVLFSSARVATAQVELKNDNFTSGGMVYAQGGFYVNEIGASRFLAPAPGPTLLKIQLLFGGASSTRNITLKVWDDSAGTDTPGVELFSGDFTLTGSDSALSEITLPTAVTVPQQFRVGILFTTGGNSTPAVSFPSIARDNGPNTAGKNYIYGGGTCSVVTSKPCSLAADCSAGEGICTNIRWGQSGPLPFGVAGNWVIRAFVSGSGGSPDAGVGGDGVPDAGVGAACQGNTDCPIMQFCDLATHHCTFECRVAADCGTGTCNSLGMCVGAATGKGGGCCQTERGGNVGGVLLGIGVLFLMRRRRR